MPHSTLLHELRRVTPLDGVWDFAFPGDVDAADIQPRSLRFDQRMAVPGAFDAMPGLAGSRGLAAYRAQVRVTPGREAFIEFDAVNIWCRVFVDGVQAGDDHAWGWTRFRRSLPAAAHALREIVVLVDNRFDTARSPLHEHYFDYHHWGGILRGVRLHEYSGPFLSSVRVTPLDPARGIIRMDLDAAGVDGPVEVGVAFDDGVARSVTAPFRAGTARIELRVPAPRLWGPDRPELHTARVRLGNDDLPVRFGLRTISADGDALRINGRPVRLLGVNRHESHGATGGTLSDAQIVADVRILEDLGCNFVRGSHYPQDPRFLDLCDDRGLLVWEEGLAWQQKARHFADPLFVTQHAEMLREMVAASYNHPSVVMWGYLNEGDSNEPTSRPIYSASASLLRELDPARPVTYASHRPEADLNFDLSDIVSVNLYPGWYGGEDVADPLGLVAPRLAEVAQLLKAGPASGRPLILSEIGSEGLYGWHDAFEGYFTEEYQARHVTEAVRSLLADPRWAGIALWHFSDARTYRGSRAMGRPRAYNNKGLLDEYRRPKQSYRAVRELYRSAHGSALA